MAHIRSLEHDKRYWSHFENSSCTTVNLWQTSLHDGTVVEVFVRSQITMSAYFYSLALQPDAATSPLCAEAVQKTSNTCPYSFCYSGHRVRAIRMSSTGGSLTAINSFCFVEFVSTVIGSNSPPMPPSSSSLTRYLAAIMGALFIKPSGYFLASDSIDDSTS
jgi:hypothetical protein